MGFGQAPNTLPHREASFVIDLNMKGAEIPQKALDLFFRYPPALFGLHEGVENLGGPVARDDRFLAVN
jgi:hypothetical protein